MTSERVSRNSPVDILSLLEVGAGVTLGSQELALLGERLGPPLWLRIGAGILCAAGLVAWLAGARQDPAPSSASPSPAREFSALASDAPGLRPGRVRAARAPLRGLEPESCRTSAKLYELPPDVRAALQSYRTGSAAEREEALIDLALSDDPVVLGFLLGEGGAAAGEREALIEALGRYGRQEMVLQLRELASAAALPRPGAAAPLRTSARAPRR
jgi:hypothetical protein